MVFIGIELQKFNFKRILTAASSNLFRLVTRCHTNRKKYENRAIDEEMIQRLKNCIDREGFRLDILTSTEDKSAMSDLLAKPVNPAWK